MARIREVQAAEWDAVLAGFAQATPFDTAAYKTAYAACMGQPVPRYFTCTEKGVVLCALAHFSAKGKGVHPKYTPYQTLLLQPSALIKPTGHFSTAGGVAVGQLLAHAHNALGTLAYTLPDAQTDLRPFATSTAAQPIALKDRYTIVNALAPLAEAEKQAQKEIRQGMERGFVCLPLHDVPAFCSLHRETALRKGFYDAATLPGLEGVGSTAFYSRCGGVVAMRPRGCRRGRASHAISPRWPHCLCLAGRQHPHRRTRWGEHGFYSTTVAGLCSKGM